MKYKVGDKIKIIKGTKGCHGAEGKIGIITNKPSTDGLIYYKDGFNIDCGDEHVWRIGFESECELLRTDKSMNKYTENKEGYIVFEDSGTSPISYGASEKWFPTYDEAIKYALNTINKRVKEIKDFFDLNSVVVYEGSEKLLHETHSCPANRIVVFCWSNYYRRSW